MEKLKLGTVYFAGEPYNAESCCQHPKVLVIGDTVPGKEIVWIKDRDKLIADRTVCFGMSWDELNEMGFIFGKPILIDDKPYWCRSLRIGARSGDPNEWDAALDKYGESDDFWGWRDFLFWGQESNASRSEQRFLRGRISARGRESFPKDSTTEFIGFRPVLEILQSVPKLTEKLIGKQLNVFGPKGDIVSIAGTLIGFDEYDLVLSNTGRLPLSCGWATHRGKTTVINRSSIIFLQKIG